MIDTSTQTPTFPPIFKWLYLHNVWCLHQHQSNSDGNIEAALVGHGEPHWKACVLTSPLGWGLEAQDFYLFMSFPRRTSGCFVSAESDRNSIFTGTCLSEWLGKARADAGELRFVIAKPFVRGRCVWGHPFTQYELIKVYFWGIALFLNNMNKWREAHSHL